MSVVATVGVFETASLARAELEAIARFAARAVWPDGFNVYQRGANADGIFIVTRGRVVLRCRVKSGRGFIPAVITPGGTFGGEGLATTGLDAVGAPHSAVYMTEARADDETETLHLSGARFRALVREQPQHALALVGQAMAEHAALLERVRELATLSVEQRLVAVLTRMARQRTFLGDDGRLALDAAGYRVLCELVGATRESVSLVLNRLVVDGAAERRDSGITIDPQAVARLRESEWTSETPIAVVDERGSTRATA
jgi:CRP/FNR family transcriptional regulator, cyclic AMP receptor protein